MARMQIDLSEADFNLVVFLAFNLDLIDFPDFAYFYRHYHLEEEEIDLVSEFPYRVGLDCYKELKDFCIKNITWVKEQFLNFYPQVNEKLPTCPDTKWLTEYREGLIESWLDNIEDINLIIKYVICKDSGEDI